MCLETSLKRLCQCVLIRTRDVGHDNKNAHSFGTLAKVLSQEVDFHILSRSILHALRYLCILRFQKYSSRQHRLTGKPTVIGILRESKEQKAFDEYVVLTGYRNISGSSQGSRNIIRSPLLTILQNSRKCSFTVSSVIRRNAFRIGLLHNELP